MDGGHWVDVRNDTFLRINELGVTHTDIIQTAGNVYAESYDIIFEGHYVASSDAQLCNLSKDNNNNMHSWTFRNNVVNGIKYACNIGDSTYGSVQQHVLSLQLGQCVSSLVLDGNRRCVGGDIRGLQEQPVHRLWRCNKRMVRCRCNRNLSADSNYVTGVASAFSWKNNFNELHGINGGNPKFVNIMTGNFKLQAGSPAINKGTTINTFNYDKDRVPDRRALPGILAHMNIMSHQCLPRRISES